MNMEWTWNYPYTEPEINIQEGKLSLSGKNKEGNIYGTALCLRPQITNYTYETQVTNQNESFKGLTMYGDNQNLVLWGRTGNKLILKAVNNQKETILYETSYDREKIYLKIEVSEAYLLTCYQSEDGNEWTKVTDKPFNSKSIIRWDRVARPGLIHIGQPEQPAIYEYFKVKNEQ